METLAIEHLSFTYPGVQNAALRDISLKIEQGDFFVLCGHSGSGKSTLLRHIKPALAPHGKTEGRILFEGKPVTELSVDEAAEKIGYVLQSPEQQVVTDKVWHELAFGLESLGYDTAVIRRRTAEMAAFFGIENWYYKNVTELSGGQKQLLALASVMVMQPKLLVLDEPTAQLDPIAASEFLNTLQKINRELGTTIVLSEHRLEEALSMATKAAVMERGSIQCTGTTDEIGRYLKQTASEMFLAMPTAMRVWGSVDTTMTCPVTVNEGREFLAKYAENHTIFPVEERKEPLSGEEIISADTVYFRYEKDSPDVVKALSFTAHRGELFCVLGGNGSGKTTTLKLLAGVKKPYRGTIKTKGTVGMLPQDPQTVFTKKTIYEDLQDILNQKGVKGQNAEEAIREVSELCKIGGLLERHPYDVSGGEQQRAALAKILLTSPDILLLDEPTKGLDVPFKRELAVLLKKLRNSGVCIIMVSHDIEFCAQYATRCGLFFDGSFVTVGSPTEFFAGNNFYTSAANRMARDYAPNAVTAEDVIKAVGGKNDEIIESIYEKVPEFIAPEKKSEPVKTALWRRIGAWVSALAALAVLLYAAKTNSLNDLIDGTGMTGTGAKQLAIYGVFILLLVLLALFLGKKPTERGKKHGKEKLPKRTIVSTVLILILVPVTIVLGVFVLNTKQYYVTALLVMVECMLPFFLIFEGRKPQARELVIIATLIALGVAGRAAFFMLPNFKPVIAIAIIAGIAFGGETGFLVGALSMLVSNMFFSQGPWTPWQMFTTGIIGFLAGILYKKGLLARSRMSVTVFGVVTTIVIYGGIMNPAAAFIWGGQSLNLKILASYYVTGFPVDCVHAAATALFIWFGAEPMLEKLDRVKMKYGLME